MLKKLLFTGIMLSICVNFLLALTIYVPSDYSTIQSGIDASTDGDTVLVQPGTYVERINFNGKNIVLRSLYLSTQDTSYISQTIIDGNRQPNVVTFNSGETKNTLLSGFTIQNGYYDGGSIIYNGSGVLIDGTSPTIKNCIVRNNAISWFGGGICIKGNSSPKLDRLLIINNYSAHHGGGIAVIGGANPTISRSVIHSNSTGERGGGIHISTDSSKMTIINCNIVNNSAVGFNGVSGGGISIDKTANCEMVNSIVCYNSPNQIDFIDEGLPDGQDAGIVDVTYSLVEGEFNGEGNINNNPLFIDAPNNNYNLQLTSPCIDVGDPDLNKNLILWLNDPEDRDPDGSRLDMGAFYYNQLLAKIPNMEVLRRDTIIVPVYIRIPEGCSYSSASFKITGYTNKIDFISISPDSGLGVNSDWIYFSNETDTSLLVTGAGTQDVLSIGNLLYLIFVVSGTSPDVTTINISNVKIDELKPSVITQSGVISIYKPKYGDVSRNGEITAYDASLVLKNCVGLISLDKRQELNADVSLDSTISALDASLILQYGVGLIDSLPFTDSESLGCTGTVSMADTDITPGDTLNLPVLIQDGRNILSCEGILSYNTEDLELLDVIWSDSRDNVTYAINKDDEKTVFSIASPYPDGENGEFMTLKFLVKPDFSKESTNLSIDELRLNESNIQQNVAAATLMLAHVNTAENSIPIKYALSQNFPNPFNPTTTLQYGLPEATDVDLMIFDITGRKIKEWSIGNQQAGWHEVVWNGTDQSGSTVSTGVYIYCLQAGDFVDTKKMVFMK